MRRVLILVLAALSLSACNAAVSEKPLFSARDGRGAPPLKPGLWAMIEETGEGACAFDAAHPPTPWPGCAKPLTISPTAMNDVSGEKPPMAYIFAKGSPRILQFRFDPDAGDGEQLYVYLGVDAGPGRGPVTQATAWLVQCGPPGGGEGHSTGLTEHPLRGMTVRDQTCFAGSARAIRAASVPSRDWDHPLRLVWVAGPAR
jgi:hypothetical protein